MQHITDTQVSTLLDYRSVGDILQRAFVDMARGDAAVHPRQRTDCAGVKLSSMGALWTAEQVAGIKVYPTVAGQFSFAVLLFDLNRNTPVALLDGNELTRFRTAAMTAMVAAQAALPGARKFALFGAGLQGRAQAQAVCERFAFDEICVVDPRTDAEWCARLQASIGARVRIAGAQEAVEGADIVVTATRSCQPVFDGAWLRPGAFVSAIGTSTPKGRELDSTTMDRAARVIVEWKPQSLQEAGEIVLWPGAADSAKFVDLPELFGGGAPWQGGADDITVFKSVGVGLSDLATAWLAWQRAGVTATTTATTAATTTATTAA